MKPLYQIISNTAFALNLLLLFFLLVEEGVVAPAWLQAFGRMHPLLLHLPIGLLLLLAVLPFLQKQVGAGALFQIQLFVLSFVVLTAAFTAVMGFLLALEPGYSGPLLAQHKWAGIGLSWMTYALFLWVKGRQQTGRVFHLGVGAGVLLLILAGHWGARITHGDDFVLAPLKSEAVALTEDSPAYEALIVPLLQQKCYSCHNPQKAKGGLVMTQPHRFKKGGDNGAPLQPGDAAGSLLIQRLELPVDAEEHMPPDGKPQLSNAELALLRSWIDSGADMELPIKAMANDHPLKKAAEQALARTTAVQVAKYDFSPASERLIEELNIPYRTVSPLALGSPALRAAIFVRETYQPVFLEELLKVKEQLVELKLDHLPVKDEELAVIGRFPQLEVLNLNNTDLSGQHLDPIGNCKKLRSLALSGLPLDTSLAATLRELPALQALFIWNSGLDSNAVAYLRAQFPSLEVQPGFQPKAEELLQLSPPAVKRVVNLDGFEEIHLHHNFPGAVIRFTVDGSEPDSLGSEIYQEPILLSRYAVIKARAFREKWLGSKVATTTFFPRSIPIKKVVLLTDPDPKYYGSGAEGLIDGQKGFVSNFLSPLWIGYRERAFEALFYPEDPAAPVNTITLSYLQNIGSYLMAPMNVEVWAGADADHLALIKRYNPELPTGYSPNEIRGIDLLFPATTQPCFKLVARPVASLPAWHKAKGEKGWIFFDEIYFYSSISSALAPTNESSAPVSGTSK